MNNDSHIQRARKYRSKKQRPCDLCRSRKIQCKLQGDKAECEHCQKLSRRCTFVLQPLKRTYRPAAHQISNDGSQSRVVATKDSIYSGVNVSHPNIDQVSPVDNASFGGNDITESWNAAEILYGNGTLDTNRFQLQFQLESLTERGSDPLSHDFSADLLSSSFMAPSHNLESNQSFEDVTIDSQDQSSPGSIRYATLARSGDLNAEPTTWTEDYSLDKRKEYSHQIIGLSSESDPYLLQHYDYDCRGTYPMFRLDFRSMLDSEPEEPREYTSNGLPSPDRVPVHFMMTNEEIWQEAVETKEKMSGDKSSQDDLKLLNSLVPIDLGKRLIKIYTRFVHPRLPIFSREDLDSMNETSLTSTRTGLKSAIYAMATPFMFLDDELSLTKGYSDISVNTLWAIAYRSFHRNYSLAHIALLQFGLLLLQKPPDNFAVADSPDSWALSCSILAIAESLGLNLDPGEWRLPRSEIILRRRLWWLMYTQHIWHALCFGRSVHLNEDNWDVKQLTLGDFEDGFQDPTIEAEVTSYIPLILAECQLSVIGADVLKEFYTLKASRRSSSLSELLTHAQSLRKRIETWRQSHPLLSKPTCELTTDEIDLVASLQISHIIVEIMIFRALLRPLVYRIEHAVEKLVEPLPTIFDNSYVCAFTGTDLVSSLTARHFTSFWPSYTRYQLCYLSTFILLAFAHSPNKADAERNRDLLIKWRDTLRTQSRAWSLARLATIRLDAIFWKGLPSVIHGTGPDSPANLSLKAN